MKKCCGLISVLFVITFIGCNNPVSETDKSSNNNLATVELSSGTISPFFSPDTTNYSITVPSNITDITITGIAESPLAVVSGPVVKSGLVAGNSYSGSITVTAENGDIKAYRFTINVNPKSNNNNLATVELSNGIISPVFSPDTTNYSITVPSNITDITITGIAESPLAVVSGPVVKSGLVAGNSYSGSITVTAENGDIKAYRFTINVNPKSNNNNLATVELSNGIISPVFSPDTTNYSITVPNNITDITITGIAESPLAVVSGPVVKSGLVVGNNYSGSITVNAENGDLKVYEFTISRCEPEPDISLVTVQITNASQSYTLPPAFYTEKTQLEKRASSEIKSWQDLYNVGAITGSAYSQGVSEVNNKLAIDIQELENQYLETNIYGSTTINYKVTNTNPVAISVRVFFKIIANDSSEYQEYASVLGIQPNSFLDTMFYMSTAGKKVKSLTVSNIVEY
ncbi:MAG: Cadherin-like beta sandwich domain protein [Bacteroidetes bacterium ADurb.Bin302]|nr:MAG: Cadherin-like beta sandwich domain protein [Bacteroidetes bacterium ADurb.Bin302]